MAVPERMADGSIAAYPNPTEGMVHYRSAFPVRTVEITDNVGRTVLRADVSERSTGTVDISGLRAGVYTLTLRNSGNVARTKVVRE